MDLTINGGYEVYGDIVLLQLSILYVQRLDLNRRIAAADHAAPFASVNDYLLTTRFVAAGLNWASWFLAIYVAKEFGLASAILFLFLGFGSSIIATILIPPQPRTDVIAHVLSLPATLYLFHTTLLAMGFWSAN